MGAAFLNADVGAYSTPLIY